MYALYSFLWGAVFLLMLPFYAVKEKIFHKKKIYFWERLGRGIPKMEKKSCRLWIHAVSVGEVFSLQNLVRRIAEKHPEWEICFSSLTSSGMRAARDKIYKPACLFYVPFDFKSVVRKYFKRLQPDIFVLAESEIWPNLLRVARKKTKGVLLINGRMSERAYRRHYRLRFFSRRILSNVSRFLMQTEKDAERIKKIGISPEKVEVAGNLKCEVTLSPMNREEMLRFRGSLALSEDRLVVTAGSTRKGEEELLLKAYMDARKTGMSMGLIIAPRHPQRTEEILKLCASYPVSVVRRTSMKSGKTWDILIVDTLGELTRFYDLCDAAFVGGSLVPWGGHNFLEPAFFEKPVFFGPHMDNFEHLAALFVEHGAARIVRDRKELTDMLIRISRGEIEEMGEKAKSLIDSLRGATEKTISTMEEIIFSEGHGSFYG